MPNDLKIRIHSDDPRLKRHIVHDAASANYRLDTAGASIADVEYALHIPGLNQGSVGKCTAESATEVLASDPFFATLPATVQAALNDVFSNSFYSDEETLDGDGPFPPNDNGSSGLTSAKVAKNRGLISGYEHTFTAEDALKGVSSVSPPCWGTLWKTGMDDVDTTTGQVRYTGTTRGGHELSLFKIVAASEQLWFRNHWGPWGYQGSGTGWISFDDFAKSLADQGDVTFYTPLNKPSPSPAPAPASSTVTKTFAGDRAAILDQFAARLPNWHAAQAWEAGTGTNSARRAVATEPHHGYVYLDAGTGRFVTADYAAANPNTTFRTER